MSAVIVDTNILVRAFLSGKLADDKILRLIIRGQHQLVYGRRQLEEFTRVLGYRRITKKYFIDPAKRSSKSVRPEVSKGERASIPQPER